MANAKSPKTQRPFPTIAQKWDTFHTLVIPSHASKLQVTEMRRAFYCGFQESLRLLTEGVGSLPADEGSKAISALLEEANAFGRAVQAGEA